MNILHLANYYIGPKVHRNLAAALEQKGIQQTIYTAFAGNENTGANSLDFKVQGSKIIYRPILNLYTRLNYGYKTRLITKDLLNYVSEREFDFIHAHTWFSDGRSAYNLHTKFNTPYLVTIRNTDLNLFFHFFLHLRKQAKQTLLAANKIIFISEAYKKRLLSHSYFADCKDELKTKSVVIPNGIEDYWLKNVNSKPKIIHNPARLLFAGRIVKGKNLETLINVVIRLNQEGTKCILHVAGGGSGRNYNRVIKKIGKYPELFVYHNNIISKSDLINLYNDCDLFVMPSKNETFGLVYVEAISQGMPVVYTRNEGIDGFFPPETGEAVNCNDEYDIAVKIRKIIENYTRYSFNPTKLVSIFDWGKTADKYVAIYKSILTDNTSISHTNTIHE